MSNIQINLTGSEMLVLAKASSSYIKQLAALPESTDIDEEVKTIQNLVAKLLPLLEKITQQPEIQVDLTRPEIFILAKAASSYIKQLAALPESVDTGEDLEAMQALLTKILPFVEKPVPQPEIEIDVNRPEMFVLAKASSSYVKQLAALPGSDAEVGIVQGLLTKMLPLIEQSAQQPEIHMSLTRSEMALLAKAALDYVRQLVSQPENSAEIGVLQGFVAKVFPLIEKITQDEGAAES